MVINDLYRFDELAQACGNRYLAVSFISESARKLGSDNSEYRIPESKLIEWVITGHCPYTEKQLEHRKVRQEDEGVDAILCWVTNLKIKAEVRRVYKKSIQNHKLTYSTSCDFSIGEQNRINILLRMIWYSNLDLT